MKAGVYYVGDPCYVIEDHDEWMKLLTESKYFGATKEGPGFWEGEHRGLPMFAGTTAYGDGVYMDNSYRSYGVDAGLIGIVAVAACDNVKDGKHTYDGGHIITFEQDFCVWSDGKGRFKFGDLEIDTTGEDEDDEMQD